MGGVWLPETRLPPRGSFRRRPGSRGPRLARCCARGAQSATAEEGGARRCPSSAPYVRLLALGAGRRSARLGPTPGDSRGPELQRRPGPSPAGGEAPGRRPCLRPRSERLAGECGCARRRLPPRRRRLPGPRRPRVPPASALRVPGPAPLRPCAGRGLAGSPAHTVGAGRDSRRRRRTSSRLRGQPGPCQRACFPPFARGAWVVQPVSFEFSLLAAL